jgi:hypothetical protein
MNSLSTTITLQQQPTPVTCIHTCLAMALDIPAEQVIGRYGAAAMSHKQLITALIECRFHFNQMVYGTLVASGWYFLTVPSLNNRGGSHQILMHNDAEAGCSGFTVFDPSPRQAYKSDGSDLHAWWNPVLFVPGGSLPTTDMQPCHRDISSPPPEEGPTETAPIVGTGMPASLYLDEFGSQVMSLFGHPPYLVGSALVSKKWRDVDVRLILSDEEYDAWGFGDPNYPHLSARWVSLCMAYSELGKRITDLPIDFQIQQQTAANKKYAGPRSALGNVPRRLKPETNPLPPFKK